MSSDFDDLAKKLTQTADDVQGIVQRMNDLAEAESELKTSSHSLSDAGSALKTLIENIGVTTAELGRTISGLQEAVEALKAGDPAATRDAVTDIRSQLGVLNEAFAAASESSTTDSANIRASFQDGLGDVTSQGRR